MAVTKDLQELIVSAVLKNSYLYSMCREEIDDSYFSDLSCKVIYKALTSYYKKYGSVPALNECLVTIDSCWYPTIGVPIAEVKDTCCRLYDLEEPDEVFIKDKITGFIRQVRSTAKFQEFLRTVKEDNSALDGSDLVQSLVDSLDIQLSDQKIFDMTDMEQVREARISAVGSEDSSKVIPSYLDTLNKNLMFGGWQPSTVNMVVAPPGCFVGDTKIMTLDGESHTLEEMYENKIKPGIYGSSNDGTIKTGVADSVYLSEYTKDLVDVEIDGTYVIRCTPDHPFLLRTGEYCQAKDLKDFDSLMPIRRKLKSINNVQSSTKYESVENGDGISWFTHHLSAERVDRPEGYSVVHHKVTKVTEVHLDKEVPVYGIVEAVPYNNYAIALTNEEGVFVSNTGKSMLLINEGVNAAKRGFKVLHIFIGDMVEYDGFIRYVSCMSGYPQSTLVMQSPDKQAETAKLCNQQYDDALSNIRILAYPSLSVSVDKMSEDIIMFEKKLHIDFDMIIVDYPDNLIQVGKSLYEDGGTLYSSLEKLARLTKSVMLVASQPKQTYWSHEIIPLEGAAESSKKQMAVDVMLCLNTTDRTSNVGSFHLAKARKGTVGKVWRFRTDFARCRLEEITETVYTATKDANKG